MGNRSVQAGQLIRLRSRFKDDLGENVQATDVFVHIFEPDEEVDFLDLSNATVVSGVPTYLGEGIFEYEYTVPTNAEAGVWQDAWEGSLPSQSLQTTFEFSVTVSGLVESLDCQIFNNNLVEVTVVSGLQATDGSYLDEPVLIEFLTTTAPSYTNLRKVRLEVGGYLSGLPDDVIQTAILEASIDADCLTFAPGLVNSKLFQHARREYVTCQTGSLILTNLGNQTLKTKTLADLHVEYDTGGILNAMDRLRECAARWESQLMAGGGAKVAAQPSYVVKGIHDVDRPIVSRSWEATEDGNISRRVPAANDRQKPLNSRRHLRTYNRNKPKKWW